MKPRIIGSILLLITALFAAAIGAEVQPGHRRLETSHRGKAVHDE